MEESRLYGVAHPYIDEPLSKLRRIVPQLKELKPASSQDHPSDLLIRVGTKADELLDRVPNLTCDETVVQQHRSEIQGAAPGCLYRGCEVGGSSPSERDTFTYMILREQNKDSSGSNLKEYRAGRNGGAAQGIAEPRFQGFVASWVIFSTNNQVETEFRYLGRQLVDARDTYVVGFAQIPGAVESPGRIVSGRDSLPMLLQGVAWIDPVDYRIVRLRTDILAPLREIDFEKQTTVIQFGAVRIAEHDLELWLPVNVEIEMEARSQVFEDKYSYSNYRLFEVKSRITPSGN